MAEFTPGEIHGPSLPPFPVNGLLKGYAELGSPTPVNALHPELPLPAADLPPSTLPSDASEAVETPGPFDAHTPLRANTLTLPFLVGFDPVNEGPVDHASAAKAVPVEKVETLEDYAGELQFDSGPQLSAFDPNHDEPLPDRAPQLLKRILDDPFSTMPEHPGRTVQEQAYSAFVHNFPRITASIAAGFVTSPSAYGKMTDHLETFPAMYEAHKHLA